MDLKTALHLTVQRNPGYDAIVDGDKRYTRAKWGERIYRLADSLRMLGVEKGERVVVFLRNREQTVTAMMALHCIGAIAVMCNPKSVTERIKYFLKDTGARGIIVEEDTAQPARDALTSFPQCNIQISIDPENPTRDHWLSFEKLIEDGDNREPDVDVDPDDLGIIIYTSGTTGEPKGVPITHSMSFHRTAANAIGQGCHYQKEIPKVIGLMPLFHTVGIHGVFLHALLFDGSYYPVCDFHPDDVIYLIEKEKITHIFASPTHYHAMLNSKTWDSTKVSSITNAQFGGALMPENQLKINVQQFTHNFGNAYGSSEMYFMGFLSECLRQPGAVAPSIFQNVRVVKPGGSPEDVVKIGEEGEIIADLRGPESFNGYWNKPQKTAEVCRNGWYYTGDAAVLLEGGLIYITGRTDDMIITGAENIHPAEVEAIAMKYPGVLDAAVVGVPDDRWGQVVKAFVVRKDESVSAEKLDKYFKDSPEIENWKRPKLYEFVDLLPRTPSGKVQKFLLRSMK
jgi:2-furoate---CoA ligase